MPQFRADYDVKGSLVLPTGSAPEFLLSSPRDTWREDGAQPGVPFSQRSDQGQHVSIRKDCEAISSDLLAGGEVPK